MAKTTRTKELWHIPKRGSVHQTIYMVHVLTWKQFLGKSWSHSSQERMATEMGKVGLTESGGALTHQSVRTLLAEIPKYLGFVTVDTNTRPARIQVTPVGHNLVKDHDITNIPKHGTLKDYKKSGDLIESSDIFLDQMLKLLITNPQILKDCQNILVFPFKMTLRLLHTLEYLDIEEIAYILFHTKSEDQYGVVLERIKNFRRLSKEQRNAEIGAYKNTEEGKLTLVKAPTAGYYMYLCTSTGLCERYNEKVSNSSKGKLRAIKLKDKDEAIKALKKYEKAQAYDFEDNLTLWVEYFGDPNRLLPPFDAEIHVDPAEERLVIVNHNGRYLTSDIFSQKSTSITFPAFENDTYEVQLIELKSGKPIFKSKVSFTADGRQCKLKVPSSPKPPVLTKNDIVQKINEMFSTAHGLDTEYATKLKILGNHLSRNFLDPRRKGGRLEYLFFALLELLKQEKIIDGVYWYGKEAKYGICEPAPGGTEGHPDIVFEIGNCHFVLELTTIRGNRAQWAGSEASSVPDHISKYNTEHKDARVIGIFSAPSIHHQLEKNLRRHAQHEGVGMIFLPCDEFADSLSKSNREKLLGLLESKAAEQLEPKKKSKGK